MTDQWEYAELKQPLSSDAPCGEDLEDSQLLAGFDALRVFGRSVPLDPAPAWRELAAKSHAALEQSKDFRLLAHLGAAVLRTDGLLAFFGTLSVAASWLEQYWAEVYPRIDEDAILRKNALNAFADPMAIIDGLRRQPIVRHPVLGAFCLRDHEISIGRLSAPEDGEPTPDAAQIQSLLAAVPANELTALQSGVSTALEALQLIENLMRDSEGHQAVPSLDALAEQLNELRELLAGVQATEAHRVEEATQFADEVDGGSLQTIRSRQDALRALDAVVAYFRRCEPSSPIPLFLERAKRLVAKDFLEVLADIAPEALPQARAAGGMRDNAE